MTYSRATLRVLTVVAVLAALAAAIYWRIRPETPDDDAQASGEPQENAEVVQSVQEQFNTELPQPVTGAVAVQDTLWISVTAEGRAEAMRRVSVTAQVSGYVAQVPVRENQTVRQDALLVLVDTTEYALEVAAKAAALLKAEADYQATVLFDDELEDEEARARRDQFARSNTGLPQAQVEHRRALLNLQKTFVRASFGGRAADLKVVPGQFVREGDELLTLIDLNPVKVEVQVLGTEVVHLTEGRVAELEFAAFPGAAFTGRIRTINPVVDPATGTARVTVHIPNPNGAIKPGMYAEARLEAQHFPDRILVPRAAVLERNRRTMLFVLEDGRAKWRYVTTGLENDDVVELVEGDEDWVAPDEVVLVDGHHYLTHDAAVELVDDPEAAGGRPGR